jgi:protein-S-isoprenylcysteine O-methyltransferase Ste14
MSLRPVEQADRNARNRATVMTLAAGILLLLALFNAIDMPNQSVSPIRALVWGALIIAWMAMLATGGGLLLSRQMRSLMNDEVSSDNRRRAIEAGFWAAMALAVGLYFASFAWPVQLRDGIAILAEVAIAAALLRYAWLERR